MDIIRLNSGTDPVYRLFCEYAEGEQLYKRLDRAEFEKRFFEPQDGYEKVFLCAMNGDSAAGFAAGMIKLCGDVSYVTAILTAAEYRRMGLGTALIFALEAAMKTPDTKKYEFSFYNPQSLPWIVPGTPRHDHPGYPGVDMINPGYVFMKNMGYHDYAYQNSYYHKLDAFSMPADIAAKQEEAAKLGYSVTFYDKNRHYGAQECMDKLGSAGWKQTILDNINTDGAPPLLIAEYIEHDDGTAKMVGFTGPVYVQESGRGYLAGLGVHPDHRGHGLGKLLFCKLCSALKDEGAQFMTLFTGETNRARSIYEAAGMKIVRCFSCMRKEIG
ncbi:MAG: GNAT family N-acetyltransferase [Clostridia bacterium]|nr:GNAT family N-acetyltransferase [Clostridia bacterium]